MILLITEMLIWCQNGFKCAPTWKRRNGEWCYALTEGFVGKSIIMWLE